MKLLPQLRAVAQQSCARTAGRLAQQEPKLTTDRIKIVSLENYSPVTKFSLLIRAGPRHETGFNMGVSHCLRNAAYLATKKNTAVALTRSVQQIGASLTTTSTKEHIIYTIEADRDKADVALACLKEVVFDPEFHQWEVARLKHNMEVELSLHKHNFEERAIELLHQAAFRATVGRSLYAPEFMLGKYTPDMLKNYTAAHYTLDRMALVGIGCPHDWLQSKGRAILDAPVALVRQFPTGNKPAEIVHKAKPTLTANDETAKYWGGQAREEGDSDMAYIALAGEGVTLASKQLPAAYVLQRIFGTASRIKWSPNQNGRLPKAVAAALPPGSLFSVSGLNYNYSDCGLMGFFLAVDPALSGKAARAAVLETAKIANGSLTESELKLAKQQAKADLLFSWERDVNYAEILGKSVLATGELTPSREQALSQIDAVTMNDVLQVAKRATGSRTTMAAAGDLSDTPYLEQIIS